jgi:hypothetical protein
MIAHLVHLESERRDRAMRARVHEISNRVESMLDLVTAACGLCRAVATLADFNEQVTQANRLSRFVIEVERAA